MQLSSQPWPQQPLPRPKRRRVFLWVFLAVQALMLVFTIAAAGADVSQQDAQCGQGLPGQACTAAWQNRTGEDIATGLGLWAGADVILGIGYGVYRLSTR